MFLFKSTKYQLYKEAREQIICQMLEYKSAFFYHRFHYSPPPMIVDYPAKEKNNLRREGRGESN